MGFGKAMFSVISVCLLPGELHVVTTMGHPHAHQPHGHLGTTTAIIHPLESGQLGFDWKAFLLIYTFFSTCFTTWFYLRSGEEAVVAGLESGWLRDGRGRGGGAGKTQEKQQEGGGDQEAQAGQGTVRSSQLL